MPTAFGEKMVMRIFDPDMVVQAISQQLGFSAATTASAGASMVERPHGIILVTGPTGSGKTTTLYSTLQAAWPRRRSTSARSKTRSRWSQPEFNQMQVHAAIDLDFADGVRTLLRQDPDIIMVGEIRDLETAEMAVQAGAHRPPRALDAAHQRRAERGHAPARSGRAALPDPVDPDRRGGAAAGAHAVPALQAETATQESAGSGRS